MGMRSWAPHQENSKMFALPGALNWSLKRGALE